MFIFKLLTKSINTVTILIIIVVLGNSYAQVNTMKTKAQKKSELAKKQKIKEAQREKKIAEVIDNILQSFEFGTPNEIFNSLAIVRRVNSKSDLQKIKPGLLKLFENDKTEILEALVKTLTIGKIEGFNDQVIELLNDREKNTNEALINAIISYSTEFNLRAATKSLMKLFVQKDLSINNNTTLSYIHVLGFLNDEIYAQYTLNTLEREYPKISSKNKTATTKKNKMNDKNSKTKKEELDNRVDASSYWQKKDEQKLDLSLQSEMILSLGKIRYALSGSFLLKFIKAGFKEVDITNEKLKGLPDVIIPKILQAYAVNSLGEIDYKEAIPWLKYKVHRYDKLNEREKKQEFSIYIQCIAALAKMKDPSGEKILIKSMRSNSSTVRMRSAKLLSFMRTEKAAKILAYRALRDANSKVAFQCLSALMEMVEPGSTTGGKIKGSAGSTAAKNAARKGIAIFLNITKNPIPKYQWLRFMAKNLGDNEILNKIVDYMEKKSNTFLTKEKQIHMVSTLVAIIKSYHKKTSTIHSKARHALTKLRNQKRHRVAAQRAAKSIRYIKSLEKN